MVTQQEALNVLVAIGDGWSRYFLSLPGAILAHLGLLRQARHMREIRLPKIAGYLTGAALAFSVYAIVGGLIVPTAPMFPANLFNYALLDRTIHVPAPVFRSLCGLAMAFFIVRSLEVFQVEADRRLAEMEQIQVLAADRERIGRDLHDGIIQNIYAAGLSLEDARHLVVENPGQAQSRITFVMEALNRTIHDIRQYIFDLRTAEQTRELEAVLEELVHDLRLDTFLEVDLEVIGQRSCVLSSQCVAHITQVAREALSNVVQHADASQVTVRLTYMDDHTSLRVADNGRGVALDSMTMREHCGQGIANMRARAHLMGGDLILESKPGSGLNLELIVPCNNGGAPAAKTMETIDMSEQEIWV
jgi:signal transduction histidine kinase